MSTILIGVCSIFAVLLNFDGNNCTSKLYYMDQKQQQLQQKSNMTNQQIQHHPQSKNDKENIESFKLMQHCFLITNLFIYSIYGIIIGIIIIIVWYIKFKRLWGKNLEK
ncbi:MAG TPA: hypothetical protein VN704_11950 [Verrucomicrobiae bacterium]|nr:hypothetical protein [Verrucomicrobiae bacterium]